MHLMYKSSGRSGKELLVPIRLYGEHVVATPSLIACSIFMFAVSKREIDSSFIKKLCESSAIHPTVRNYSEVHMSTRGIEQRGEVLKYQMLI